ncbi:MAG: hypothetical protein V4701_06740 [Pseudomonadota bacterium]
MRTLPLCLTLALCLVPAATPSLAQEAADGNAIIRTTDGAMTCPQIADEAASLSERMGGAPRGGLLSSIGGVAKAGAAMLIPGAGLAIAGADAVTSGGREEAAAARAADENRWYYLNGLSAGRNCQGGQTTEASIAIQPATLP